MKAINNNKWKGVNLAMLIIISASLILSAAVSAAPMVAAKQNSDKSKGDKDDKDSKSKETELTKEDKDDKGKDDKDSKSKETELTISCNSNEEAHDDTNIENSDAPCDEQSVSTQAEALNTTTTLSTAPVSVF
jgi:mannitol-specific phosphotransferase system IIBC component